MAVRHDWGPVRERYVTGMAVDPDGDPAARSWPTFAEVAALFGIPEGTVHQRATAERWTEQRDQYRLDVEQERRRRLRDEHAGKALQVDRRGLSAAEAGLALVGQRLEWLIGQERARVGSDRGAGVPAGELAALGLAARRWIQVKAAVLGATLSDEATSDDLERELRVGEQTVAAQLAEHIARRAAT
jgi:hypothetical protein